METRTLPGVPAKLYTESPLPIVLLDRTGILARCNAAVGRLAKTAPEDLEGSFFGDHVHPADLNGVLDLFQRVLDSAGPRSPVCVRLRRSDGAWVNVQLIATNLLDDPDVASVIVGLQPVDEWFEADRVLEMIAGGAGLDESLGAVAALTRYWLHDRPVVIWLREPGVGLRAAASYGIPDGLELAPDQGAMTCLAAFTGRPEQVSDLSVLRDAWVRSGFASCWSTPIHDEKGSLLGGLSVYSRTPSSPRPSDYQALRRPIELARIAIERGRDHELLRWSALHDTLTSLPNRRHLLERLRSGVLAAEGDLARLAVIFLDLDGFKFVNDTLGHQFGDRVLAEVAGILKNSIRPEDMAVRLSGDEFAVLCAGIDHLDQVYEIGQRIVAQISRPMLVENHRVRLTASVGIALSDTRGVSPETLLRDADLAMYQAKETGGGQVVVFGAAMRRRATRRHRVEQALRATLEPDCFPVLLQPVVELATGRAVGAEALVRWRRTDRTLIAPNGFLEVAYSAGLMRAIGEMVQRNALAALAAVNRHAPEPLAIWINVSGAELANPAYATNLAGDLALQGLRPESVHIEIQERDVVEDLACVMHNLHVLRGMGLRIGIDDFGTGQSSLSRLYRLPIDFVKIDRSFVSGAGEDVQRSALILAVLQLAQALNLQVIAEGVECAAQAAWLAAHGCRLAQGYHFHRPLTEAQMCDLVESRVIEPGGHQAAAEA